jgi:hypothetical protein
MSSEPKQKRFQGEVQKWLGKFGTSCGVAHFDEYIVSPRPQSSRCAALLHGGYRREKVPHATHWN